MAEAEDVITDVARHATIYAQAFWRRHRKKEGGQPPIGLRDIAPRLDLLITAAFGASYPIRVAQAPAPPTFLSKLFKRSEGPRTLVSVPATDGSSIWLPPHLPDVEQSRVLDWYRVLALQQAMRAERDAARVLATLDRPLQRAVFTALEAHAADTALRARLPGIRVALDAIRAQVLAQRPPLDRFPPWRRPVEEFVRSLLGKADSNSATESSATMAGYARMLAEEMARRCPEADRQAQLLWKDAWTGDLYAPATTSVLRSESSDSTEAESPATRSARLPRRPQERAAADDEDDTGQGAWMVQTAQPHEQAEDPAGMQRPTDRDDSTAAEEFADALSELPEARLVSTPGRPKEVLLSEDAPVPKTRQEHVAGAAAESSLQYPEWDYRIGAYHERGATVHLLPPVEGPQAWVDRTLDEYRPMLHVVRRRFEMLRAQRVRLRKQLEGEEIDLEAYIDSYADFRAGAPMSQALYQSFGRARRDMAIMLLIDISGSTDSWVSTNRRIVDVEREASLLVSIALQGLGEPYAVMGFSGEGPHGVTMRSIKSFEEAHSDAVARRMAALEPEHYTRAGAAIRHAAAVLMRQAARHRLLLLLSDGKPNDADVYEGRYGVEDMRQAVSEARLQGIHPFCLTIDRQAAGYLPHIFGAHQYALLPKPELLPTVLLDWMKRLIAH